MPIKHEMNIQRQHMHSMRAVHAGHATLVLAKYVWQTGGSHAV